MSKPAFYARATVATRRVDGGEDDERVVRTIGAAFSFDKGNGYVVNLNSIPTNWDGSFILVPPREVKD